MRAHKKTGWRATIAFAAGLLVFWGPVTPALAADSIHGSATFYCNSDPGRLVLSRCRKGYPDRAGRADYYAAAGPALRAALGRHWQGQYVTVSRTGHGSVRVRLIDSCGTGCTVLIDLYGDAMVKLGGTGRINVTVSWGAPAKLPSTDTEGSHDIYRPGSPLVAS